jgi:hypothetical protein
MNIRDARFGHNHRHAGVERPEPRRFCELKWHHPVSCCNALSDHAAPGAQQERVDPIVVRPFGQAGGRESRVEGLVQL